jgi:hypothetical protein
VKELVKPFHVRENLRKFCETSMTFDHFRWSFWWAIAMEQFFGK